VSTSAQATCLPTLPTLSFHVRESFSILKNLYVKASARQE